MASDEIQELVAKHRIVGEAVRADLTGVSRTGWRTLEAREKETGEKLVPARVSISPGKSGWRFADLLEWVQNRPAYTPPPAPRCTRARTASGTKGA
ncbi:MAG: hypothetical protein H5U26_12585 [Immundisolibacter sp.]|uniref:helix-turn-helix transcriptional regulator n=1 Tax=Immundisolibacter sp. TaxID=1934948 RepID=UPI0019C7E72D|nr:hypothetical protein [Immundisolibacter sp.]MBC7162927.1 hypothetical protein [Immundisolibacter sp.]